MISQLFYLLLFLFSLYGLMFFIKKQWGVPYKQAPFIAICLVMIILYIASLFQFILIISWGVYLFGLVFFGWMVYQKHRQDQINARIFFKEDTYYPLYIFGVLFFVNWLVFNKYGLFYSDVWHFWGFRIKQLFYFQDLLGGEPMHKSSHPSISAIVHYYFTYFLNKGSFRDGVAVFSHVMLFASALPIFLFHKKHKTPFWSLLLIGVCFYFLVNSFGVLHISILYNDALLGMFFGLAIVLYMLNKDNPKLYLLTLGVVIFCIAQIKESGFIFISLIIFIIFINEILLERKSLLKSLKRIGILVLVFITTRYSWKEYLKYSYGRKERGDILPVPISSLSQDKNSEYIQIGRQFWNQLNDNRGIYPNDVYDIDLPYSLIFLFFLILAGLCLWFFYRRKSFPTIFKNYKHYILFVSLVALCLIGYLVITLISQMLGAGTILHPNGFSRYLGAGFMGVFLVLFLIIIKTYNRLLLLLFFVFLVPIMHYKHLENTIKSKKVATNGFVNHHLNVFFNRQKLHFFGFYAWGSPVFEAHEVVTKEILKNKKRKTAKIFILGGFSRVPEYDEIIRIRTFPFVPEIHFLDQQISSEELQKKIQGAEYFITWLPEDIIRGYLLRAPNLKGVWVNKQKNSLNDNDLINDISEGFKRIK